MRIVLITASIATFGFNIGDIEILLNKLLVEFRQSARGGRYHIDPIEDCRNAHLSSVKSLMMPTSSRVPACTQAVMSNCSPKQRVRIGDVR